MRLSTLDFPLEVKEIAEDGLFLGHAATFGNLDRKGDIILPGAFDTTIAEWKARSRMPPILWQHNMDQPIGATVSMEQDEKGLAIEGKLVKTVRLAHEAYDLLRAKVINALSIGFQVPSGASTRDSKGIRSIKAVNLWENSLVTFGANDLSLVSAVKSALSLGELPSLAEFEEFLRDSGFSKKQACAIASAGLRPLLRSESGDRDVKSELAQDLLATLRSQPITE